MSNPGKDLRDGPCCASAMAHMTKLMEQPLIIPCSEVVAHALHLTFPPGDLGSDPHTHPGPVVGYVLEGEFLFQMSDETPRIIKAGGAFHEKIGEIHVWSANASNETTCKVIATVLGRPGEPVVTYVEGYARVSRDEALALACSI